MTRPKFLTDLESHGYTVIRNVVPRENCDTFVEEAWNWLESFPNGFRRDDRSTWNDDHLPFGQNEPGILKAFGQIWGTDDLIASFDGINVSLPISETGRTDIKPTSPWPHIDQDPRKVDRFELYQGIANLAPNGPKDGGLVVLAGSHKLHEQYFEEIGGFRPDKDLGVGKNGYDFNVEDLDWYRARGCEEVKICAEAGDLILWDSRSIHWNASPVGEQPRFITYVCYCPRSHMTEEMLEEKREIFKARKGTTHWPQMNVVPADRPEYFYALPRRPDNSVDPANRKMPFKEPIETDAVLRLVGVRT